MMPVHDAVDCVRDVIIYKEDGATTLTINSVTSLVQWVRMSNIRNLMHDVIGRGGGYFHDVSIEYCGGEWMAAYHVISVHVE